MGRDRRRLCGGSRGRSSKKLIERLEWDSQWTKSQSDILRRKTEQGEVPDILLKRPELSPGLSHIYEAFFSLGRSLGMGVGPLYFAEMVAWLDEHQIQGRTLRDFYINCWRRMDEKYLEIQSDKTSKKSNKAADAKPPNYKPTMGRK